MSYNNFLAWFPDGAYRKNNQNPALVADLDGVIKDARFDLAEFHELRGRHAKLWGESVALFKKQRGRDATPEEEAREPELEAEMSENWRALDQLLQPIYDRMVESGYSHEDLVR